MINKKREAEITIAQIVGEIKQLMVWQMLYINPTLSFDRAKEIAEEEVRELFNKLENSYKDFFENE